MFFGTVVSFKTEIVNKEFARFKKFDTGMILSTRSLWAKPVANPEVGNRATLRDPSCSRYF